LLRKRFMATNTPRSGSEPLDREAFEVELSELITQAHRAGVTITGSYDVETPQPNRPPHTIEITKFRKSD
jgi:hypothetical protein